MKEILSSITHQASSNTLDKKSQGNELISFFYIFHFEDGSDKEFVIHVDRKTLNVIPQNVTEPPPWAALTHRQCRDCPLSPDTTPYCPAAVNLLDLINFFKTSLSFRPVEVTLRTNERTYFQKTSLQKALSSMMGILMAGSTCPTLEKLKPMIRFHLPFATLDETLYRIMSMYLVGQFFVADSGGKPDWNLEGLTNIYKGIRQVNIDFVSRIRKICEEDALANALVILNTFADNVILSLERHHLQSLKDVFEVYWKDVNRSLEGAESTRPMTNDDC